MLESMLISALTCLAMAWLDVERLVRPAPPPVAVVSPK